MIQTFPSNFQLPGCKSDVEQVIGNAVPVKLAEYVGSRLISYIHDLESKVYLQQGHKDTPKHETCVPCVGRVSTRHGRLKSALQHAILIGCGRCFTLIYPCLVRVLQPFN